MTKIGDILTHDELPEVRVVGAAEGTWVIEEVELSDGPRIISPEERAAYGVHDTPRDMSSAEAWAKIGESFGSKRREILPERPRSPEQTLAQGEGSKPTFQIDGRVYEVGEAPELEGQPQSWRGTRVYTTDEAPWLGKPRADDHGS